MPSRTVLSTSCSGHLASATGIFKAGSVRYDPDGSLPRPAKLFDPEPFRTTDYAFGVKKPRRRQIRQRPYSSSARGVVPACPARCLRWSPYVQMPAPSGTRIGAVSSTVRGVEVLFRSLLTVPLRSTSLLSLRNVRTGLARVLLTNACSLGWLCCGLLALPARNGKQHLALSLNPPTPFARRSRSCF